MRDISEKPLHISYVGNDRTVVFAAHELQECLAKMTGKTIIVDVNASRNLSDNEIMIGMHSDLPFLDIPQVDNSTLDDLILIDIRNGAGYIAGNNPRSVLLAVYRYLTMIGCRWPRPGSDGEYIPQVSTLADVSLIEIPSYRHRGVCIEGYTGYDHLRDMIDWIPKLGFNTYFMQFRDGFVFFDRYYSHEDNAYMENRRITHDEARLYTTDAIDEIHKRGMILHIGGHGWTCEPFNISETDSHTREYSISPEFTPYLAMINGTRSLWNGDPIYTNLCYSNPATRKLIIEEIVNYAEELESTDILHFWLADGANNNCECENCAVLRPSDFYVQMLNELDSRLNAKGSTIKIVFLIYADLLWPPILEHIENPDRYILMFAPSSRTYSESLKPEENLPDLPAYTRNKLEFPRDVYGNVAFLKKWQSGFPGDSFDFDYHLLFDPVNDPGHMRISEIIYEDMKALKTIGLNGYVSCQLHRIFLPSGLAMNIMGKTLWNTELDFNKEVVEYFNGAFGPNGAICQSYLSKISTLFDPVYMRGEKPVYDEVAASRFKEAVQVIREFKSEIKRNLLLTDLCHQQSWKYLEYHADITQKLAEALELRAMGDVEKASEIWNEEMECIRRLESILNSVLDVTFYNMLTNRLFHM
ncbi:MAG: DUF4838 domain-containing protein [Armatimonadota bacterium]